MIIIGRQEASRPHGTWRRGTHHVLRRPGHRVNPSRRLMERNQSSISKFGATRGGKRGSLNRCRKRRSREILNAFWWRSRPELAEKPKCPARSRPRALRGREKSPTEKSNAPHGPSWNASPACENAVGSFATSPSSLTSETANGEAQDLVSRYGGEGTSKAVLPSQARLPSRPADSRHVQRLPPSL